MATKDQIPQQTHPLRPGKTRVQEERLYHTIKGSAQATQATLAHTMAQCKPTVKRGPAKQPQIKPFHKGQASDKMIQMKEKDKSH